MSVAALYDRLELGFENVTSFLTDGLNFDVGSRCRARPFTKEFSHLKQPSLRARAVVRAAGLRETVPGFPVVVEVVRASMLKPVPNSC